MMRMKMKASSLLVATAVAGMGIVAPAFGATYRYDNNAATGNYATAGNWIDTASSNRNVPGAADTGDITGPYTVGLSSAQSAADLQMAGPGVAGQIGGEGTTRLNISAGANLNIGATGNTNGFRIGRSSATAGSSRAEVVQTGGSVNVNVGANGYRLSATDTTSASSLYRISGGSMTATAVAGTGLAIADLRVGLTSASYGGAEFHVLGSGATSIRFLDVQVADSNTAGGGSATFHFTLDAAGVTPIVAEDEFQFRAGTNTGAAIGQLVVDMNADAPTSDVTLVIADRLGNNGGALERFANYADLAPLTVNSPNYTYSYLVDYTDASDNYTGDPSQLDASIILRYQGRTALTPEPTAFALLGAGGLVALRRRRA